MPDAVAAVMRLEPEPGELFILNDPFHGGTHLPDITLVSRTDLGYAVTRAHHADVGGMEPSSLPAESREIFQEGIVIPPTRLTGPVLELLLANMRNPQERRGDLQAQIAAQRLGARRVAELCERHGRERVEAAMDQLFAYAERRVRAGIAALPDGRYRASDRLEPLDGRLELHVTVTIAGDEVEIDFTGTSSQHRGNLNCPLAVTRSASYFVIRCLTAPDLVASGGAHLPVHVTAPTGCLVNAQPPAAVVAGNTETSSRITDVLMAALGEAVPVQSMGQGTMNNVTFGNERFTYYETIGGGQGATATADGPSAVHVAMSNSLNTPVEALELAYPLRIRRYSLRPGSGGDGRFRGGDGVVREYEALEPCRVSVLTERRVHPPRGQHGAEDGALGRNLLNGEPLDPKATTALSAGDVLTIETPGGGGFGATTNEGNADGGT
jgi:N-methylhydantoinase B